MNEPHSNAVYPTCPRQHPRVRRSAVEGVSSNVNKKSNIRKRTSAASVLPTESNASIAATVFWMLSALATAAAEVMWCVAAVTNQFSSSDLLKTWGNLSLFIAAVTAGCTLLATPVVLNVRQQQPPRAVTWGVVVIASLALVAAAVA